MKRRNFFLLSIALFGIAFFLFHPAKVFATGTCNWTGASSADWSDNGNWTGSCSGVAGIPGNGDALSFSDDAFNANMNNDIVGLDLASLSFDGINDYSLSGNEISISSAIESSLPAPIAMLDINTPITLTGDATFDSLYRLTIGGNIHLNGHQLTLSPHGILIFLNGDISGTGNLVGTWGTTIFTGNNTFTGSITLGENTSFSLRSATAAGNVNNVISLTADNAAIDLGFNVGTIPNNISLANNNYISSTGENTLTGEITLNGDLQVSSDVSSSYNLNLNGPITGNGNIKKIGTGTVTIGGSASNTFTGTYTTTEGPTYLAKTSGATAIRGTAIVGNGTGGAESVQLILNEDNQIAGNIQTESDGKFDMNGHDETANGLTGSGVIAIPTGSTLTLDNDSNTTTTFSGSITGVGDIVKSGSGTQGLTGDSAAFTGTIRLVDDGQMEIDGDMSQTSVTYTEWALMGTGTLKDFTLDGTTDGFLSPGHTGVGTLHFANSVTLDSGVTFASIFIGTTPGTEYGQIVAGGDINLGNAHLAINPTFTPAIGSQFILAQSTGGAINGTFAGLPNFSSMVMGGRQYQITYTSNEVILAVISTLYNPSFTANPSSPTAGKAFTVKSTWTGTAGTPTGTAKLYEGSTKLRTVSLVGGIATFSILKLPAGTHTLHVVYDGDSTYHGAVSNNLTVHVKSNSTGSATASDVSDITPTPSPTIEQPTETVSPTPAETTSTTPLTTIQEETPFNWLLLLIIVLTLSGVGYFVIRKKNSQTK